MADIVNNPSPQSNPPDPQVPTSTTTTVVPDRAPATVSNPPNPQVPSDGSIRIDITTGGPAPVNDDVDPTLPRPGQGTITPVQVDPAPQVVEVQATGAAPVASGAGITGPVSGISPYGEADDLPEVVQNTAPSTQAAQTTAPAATITGTGITGPVEGFSPYGEENDPPDLVENASPTVPADYAAIYNPETGKFDVVNLSNNEVVYADQTEQSATLKAQDLNAGAVGYYYGNDEAEQIADNPNAIADPAGVRQQTTLAAARAQQVLRDQQKQVNQGDWRVKLRLAPGATYLYDDPSGPGILTPLSTTAGTGGVVFPYTPQIQYSYNANYNSYDLTHSNYRGYFYQGSNVGDVQLQAMFTAQDTDEAAYLLAVIHFFRSVTKMFYGANDAFAGTPPPLVFLEGFGEYQFNRHPMVVSQFNYTLPDDVDYIRARSPNISSTNIQFRRTQQDLPTNPFSSAWSRLLSAGLTQGAIPGTPPPAPIFGTNQPTYVPTKINISLVLLPMQTRQQISQNFNLKSFANGQLIKGGFW